VSGFSTEEKAPRRHIPIYDDVLKVVEVWILIALLFAVIVITTVNILQRNFQFEIWDDAVTKQIVYALTFYLGLMGGVVASRRARHISIDAVSHFLPNRLRMGVSAFLQLVGAATCVLLACLAYQFLSVTENVGKPFIEGQDSWWLLRKGWLFPMVVLFSWMVLHFLVNSIRFAVRTLWPEPVVSNALAGMPAAPKSRTDSDDDGDGQT
jgi:TRAP-type C4-dicarboxylate transport system permease small subunit